MYSLRDSIIKPEELVARLKEIKQDAVAITDHGSVLSGVTIYKLLKENSIKYIHGCELYVCDNALEKDKDSKYYHLVVLCKNDIGRVNLNRLITKSEHPDHFYYKPRIDFEMLSKYGEGLVVMSACLAGEVSKNIMSGDIDGAKQIALKYKNRFQDDYYLEIQSHTDEDQILVNKKILEIADDIGVEVVVTCDAHYTVEEDKKYQNKYAFNGSYKEDGEAYTDCFIQSEDDVRKRLWYLDDKKVDELISNTHKISDKCNVELPISPPIMPHIETPKEHKSNKEWLETLCINGFREKLGIDFASETAINDTRDRLSKDEIDTYIKRYQYELDSLERMGFLDYILLVYSYANVAKRRGIARGSGGGSLICYLTNITDIDPIEHNLYFERFIDVGALELLESGEITRKELKIPDIDLDFSSDSCEEVLRFLYNTYGEDMVASIGKFGTNQTKGTIRDMCRVLDIDLITADKIAKSFENYEIDDIDMMISGEIDAVPSAQQAIEYVQSYPELFDYVRKLNGLPKSFGLHACGKIISTKDLDEFLPSCYDANGIRYLQGDMHDVEDVGLVKIDVLGLRTLDQEYDTLEMSKEEKEFINPKQRFDDPRVLEIFRSGDTFGIFQMSSFGMRQTLKKMDVSGIEDISIANALYRPGAMPYIDNFCDRRKGKEEFQYLHPDLEPILKNTYGIIVFQEQLIEIGRMAGLRNPDLLRKATGKKNPDLLAKIKPELMEKLIARGWSESQFEQLWKDMLEFAKYSFNKSHSSAYGIIAYMTAKQKAYYPAEFFAGLCNSYIGRSAFVKDNADEVITDMSKHKIRLAPLNFRNDHRRCSVSGNKIVYAIPLIKDFNEEDAEILFAHRNTDRTNFWELVVDLVESGLAKSKVKTLITLDLFREYGTAKELLRVLDVVETFNFGKRKTLKKEMVNRWGDEFVKVVSQNSRGTGKDGKELKSFSIVNIDNILTGIERIILSAGIGDLDYKVKIANQKEYLGFVSLVTGKEEDRSLLFVKSIYPLKRKVDKKQFGYSFITQSLGSGIESRFTVFNKTFEKEPVAEESIIRCLKWTKDKGFFTMNAYTKIA